MKPLINADKKDYRAVATFGLGSDLHANGWDRATYPLGSAGPIPQSTARKQQDLP